MECGGGAVIMECQGEKGKESNCVMYGEEVVIERRGGEESERDGQELIKSVISCDGTSETTDAHSPPGRS